MGDDKCSLFIRIFCGLLLDFSSINAKCKYRNLMLLFSVNRKE